MDVDSDGSSDEDDLQERIETEVITLDYELLYDDYEMETLSVS